MAARLFHERGFVHTSISDIAAAIGILPGSLYHYIDSKDDLLFLVVERAHRDLIDRVERQPLDTMTAAEALHLVARIHVEAIVENTTFAAVSNTDGRELSPTRRQQIMALRARYQRQLIDLVARGQREGAWCARLDPVLASFLLPGLGNSLVAWYRVDATRWSVDTITEQYASMVARALSCDHEPPCTAG
ncbi:MAG: TetR/AcrR family transcriptional regulator [Desertimonas sp.]